MKSKLFLLVGVSVTLLVYVSLTGHTQPRGQGVRIKVESGQEIDLYDESHALVIGVSNYDKGWRRLPGVRTDVTEVSRVLKAQGFQSVTVAPDVTREEFDAALRSFIGKYGLRERNRLVIYFAGHGHTERLSDDRDLGYIVMRNAPKPDDDPNGFYLASVSMDEINSSALRIKAKHALFVFDSCFSGTIFRSEPERRVPPAIASLTAAPVRQFITSGAAGQTVPDDSIFRAYFVRAFEQRLGDLNDDGFITGEELGKYLMGQVASDSRDTQTPRFGKIKDAKLNLGDLVFALPKKAVPTPIPLPMPVVTPTPVFDPASFELALWNSAQRNDDISDYEDYLRQYPSGRFAVSARNRMIRLRAPVMAPPVANPTPAGRTSVTGVPLRAFNFETVTTDTKGVVKTRRQGEAYGYTEDINGVPLELVELSGDTFTMGSPTSEANHNDDETPHQVTVSGLMMGKYEITQAQWQAVAKLPKVKIDLPADTANFKGATLPVERVSWEEAVEFCARLSQKTGRNYRLPTEAEWEYAARAGTTTPFAFGETVTPALVNYDGNYPYGGAAKGEWRKKTVAVGSLKAANAFGLYDLHGNVWEWCQDWYAPYGTGAQTNPTGPTTGESRVLRGGSWYVYSRSCRAAVRAWDAPGNRNVIIGFRVVMISRTP